jgi:hypothetical protein
VLEIYKANKDKLQKMNDEDALNSQLKAVNPDLFNRTIMFRTAEINFFNQISKS